MNKAPERKRLLAARVDDEFHAAAREAATRRGITVHDFIMRAFRRVIKRDARDKEDAA